MFTRDEIDEHNRIEDAKKQGRTIAHTGTLYGVRQETLEAYLKAERKKVWEAAATHLEENKQMQPYLGPLWNMGWGDAAQSFANWCRGQASKETQP